VRGKKRDLLSGAWNRSNRDVIPSDYGQTRNETQEGKAMALTAIPTPATLAQIYVAQGKNPAAETSIVSGNVTPPTNFVAPTCQFNCVLTGMKAPPAAAARRLGTPSRMQTYKVTFQRLQPANPGTNTAVYLKAGVYETNWTFDENCHRQGVKEALVDGMPRGLINYCSPWQNASQKRVYLVMPKELENQNAGAEREHCSDFIYAYKITLDAVDAVFQKLNGKSSDEHWSRLDAQHAMEKQVESQLPSALGPVACAPNKLVDTFNKLLEKSRTGRDGKAYHSFGVELISELPHNLGPITYLTGTPRQEGGRVYLCFTCGTTQIGVFPSSAVMTL